jgi:hypothetical protein
MKKLTRRTTALGAVCALGLAGLTTGVVTMSAHAMDESTCTPGSTQLVPVVAINAGGPALEVGGKTWEADTGQGGHQWASPDTTTDIADTDLDALYRTERAAEQMSYEIALPNGTYQVRLHMAETYWGAPGGSQPGETPGRRVESFTVEGQSVVSDLDLVDQAGGTMTAFVRNTEATVADGALSVAGTASVDMAQLNGIEVFRRQACGEAGGTPSATASSSASVKAETSIPQAPLTSGETSDSDSDTGSDTDTDSSAPPSTSVSPTATTSGPAVSSSGGQGSAATRLFGATLSGLPWHSGAWTAGAGSMGMDSLNVYSSWRGSQLDFVTTYSEGRNSEGTGTWADMMGEGNDWLITTYKDFPGKLNYGLALLSDESRGDFSGVINGSHDDVWTHIAQTLKDNGHGDAAVRLGWEFDIDAPGWPWVISADQADEYKAAYRHVVGVMRGVAPELKFEFGVNCGSDLEGASDRLAPLTMVYPGDDVVDLVGCDAYNWWSIKGSDEASFQQAMHPENGVGIGDVVDFARQHGKGASFGEWGTAVESNGNGGGDDAFYMKRMFQFFQDNKDVVAFECYFDEGAEYIANSLFNGQNPQAAAVYLQLWGK